MDAATVKLLVYCVGLVCWPATPDAAIRYTIVTLKSGEMITNTSSMASFDECERTANERNDRILTWCRREKIIVLAH
jgi:hypothetical protein